MITINANNLENAERLLRLAPNEIKSAALAAVNRTASKVNTQTSRSIREKYNIKAKIVKSHIKKQNATKSSLTAKIIGSGAPFLITHFTVRKRRKGPLLVRVLKRGNAKPVPGMFLGTARKGFTGAMMRLKRSSYPLRIPYGPSVPTMFGNRDVANELESMADKWLNERFNHEVNYRFGKLWRAK